MKYYSGDGDFVYDLEHWIDEARHDPKGFVIVENMKRDIGGEMFCQYHGAFVERGCNEGCQEYGPCNGKNGRCRELKHGFIGTGGMYRITENGSVRRAKT